MRSQYRPSLIVTRVVLLTCVHSLCHVSCCCITGAEAEHSLVVLTTQLQVPDSSSLYDFDWCMNRVALPEELRLSVQIALNTVYIGSHGIWDHLKLAADQHASVVVPSYSAGRTSAVYKAIA